MQDKLQAILEVGPIREALGRIGWTKLNARPLSFRRALC